MTELDERLRGKNSFSYFNKNFSRAERKNTPYYPRDIDEGIRFLFSHFQEPLFPRTISTKQTANAQITVYNSDRIYEEFEKSNFMDCRISAFPLIENCVPNLVFIDLDKNDEYNTTIETKLEVTLTTIKKRLGGHPSVLWTGNGYHIYQPFDVPTKLSEMDEFKDFEGVDNKFLRFEKDFLSDGYADKSNHPSLKSCLLRVPGSINSKCLVNGLGLEESRIKIIHRWDGKRVPISFQLGTFLSYLISERGREERRRDSYNKRSNLMEPKEIPWIEKLLQTPIEDHRKFCLWRILIPYLVNIKDISKSHVILILEKWIKECDKKRKIDFDYKDLIKSDLRGLKDHKPISLHNLKKENPFVHNLMKF